MKSSLITCSPKSLPEDQTIPAADTAVAINPINHPQLDRLTALRPDFTPSRFEISVVTTKYWHTNGVRLTVAFLDNPPAALRTRIISHMNAWAASCNVNFTYTTGDADVRIARAGGDNGGYWSYVGTDILHIPKGQPTMNLEAFTMNTPESEFHRVVRHETGHTLGSPHEHMRRELVALIDPAKAIKYFQATQGWSAAETQQQVLTPIEESTLRGTPHADPNSIMCYQLPGTITKNGKPIVGGLDIDALDYSFMASIYPKPVAPPAKPTPAKPTPAPAKKTGAKTPSTTATKSTGTNTVARAKKSAKKSATLATRERAGKAANQQPSITKTKTKAGKTTTKAKRNA